MGEATTGLREGESPYISGRAFPYHHPCFVTHGRRNLDSETQLNVDARKPPLAEARKTTHKYGSDRSTVGS